MATFTSKKNKSSASTGNTEGSTTSSSPALSVNLVTTNTHTSQPQHNTHSNNNNNAPKYGTRVPNRIFVGGISGSTTETELAQLFSAYGSVKATKVISDRAGVSKGYGFVTFETEEEAKRLMDISESIVLKERKLNIAPAIKKQPFNRTYEAASPPAVHSSTFFYQNGFPYTFHDGMAYFPATPPQHTTGNTVTAAGDTSGMYQATFGPPPAANAHSPAAAYSVIYPCTAPPAMYVSPQQFQYQPVPPPAPTSQYIYTASTLSTSAAAPGTGPPVSQGSPMLGAPAPMPPTQHYYTPAPLNPTDMYYSMPQPYNAVMNEGIVYESSPPGEASSNQSAEDSYSNSSNSDTVRSGGGGSYKPPPNQEKTVAKPDSKPSGNGGWVAPPTATANNQSVMQRQNASTPVVSLLKLQQTGEELDICPTKKCSSPTIQDYMTTLPPQQIYYQQVPPPVLNPSKSQTPVVPVVYQSVPPMFVAPTGQPSGTSPCMNQFPSPGMANGHSDQSGSTYPGQFQNHRAPYATRPYTNRRGGASSGNQSPMTVHIPPFPSKFHFMNNNYMHVLGVNNPHTQGSNQKCHYNNRNVNQQHRGRDSGRYVGPNPGRMQRRFLSTNTAGTASKNSASAVSTCITSANADSSIPHTATTDMTTTITSTTATTTITVTSTTTSLTTTITATTTTPTIATSATTITTDASSPPPAPYSPMTYPVIDSTSPPQQVQFFSGTVSSAGHQTCYPPTNGMQQQLVPPQRFFSSSRKSGSSTMNGGNTSISGGSHSSGGGNRKYSKGVVNSVQVTSGVGNLIRGVDEGSLGSVGDAPPTSCGAVLQEACHQMKALSL